MHLRPSTLASHEKLVRFGAPDSEVVPMNIYALADFSIKWFSELRNAERYTEAQISDLVSWFNEFHVHWRICDTVHQGICVLASELVDRYDL